jgi:transcriptional regulator with XRE-family HTH domain
MNQINNGSVPLSQVIRQHRGVLGLTQAQVAAELNIEPESVSLWENGRRRVELDKLPRLAVILRLHAADVCRLALFQWNPRLYASLFGSEPPQAPRALNPSTDTNGSGRPPALSAAGAGGPPEPGVIISHGLGEGKELA